MQSDEFRWPYVALTNTKSTTARKAISDVLRQFIDTCGRVSLRPAATYKCLDCELSRFVRYFDGIYAGVVLNRGKVQNDQARRIWLDAMECLRRRLVGSASFLEDVVAVQQRGAVCAHVEQATGGIGPGILGAKVGFSKTQRNRISAWRYGYLISEVSIPLAVKEMRIRREIGRAH